MEPLFAPLEPYATRMFPVSHGHTLYVEESGNPNGLPVLVLHGGPGSGCRPDHRRRFDPAVWRIVCLDQRGCGRSIAPSEGSNGGILHANTTPHLVADNEAVREALGITQWACVYGTSWGSTLALVYAEAHPEKVKSIVLSAVFLPDEAFTWEWATSDVGLPLFYPEAFAKLRARVPNLQGLAMVKALHAQGPEAVLDLMLYEGMAADMNPDEAILREYFTSPHGSKNATIQAAYYARQCDLTSGQILANIGKIAHLPITILQGLQDMVCPPKGAHKLYAALQAAGGTPTLRMVGACGHRSTPAMEAARVEAIAEMAKQIAA